MPGSTFTKLEVAEPFPGTVTKLHTGMTQVQVGDLLQVEWMHAQPFIGQDIAGRVKAISDEERPMGPRGPERIFHVTLEEGWYSYGFDLTLAPGPNGWNSPQSEDGIMTGVPTANRAEFERTIELSTTDTPGWHAYIVGADSEARLEELEELSGGRFKRTE